MAWNDDLLPEQRDAASHIGSHARLLAGPGTGKTLTLTRHICFLVNQCNVPHRHILAVTFTRAAARELRQRVENELGEEKCPRISTLHSFALRQLLGNACLIDNLPQPLRIADDWEERNIILEDIKSFLILKKIKDAQNLLNELSSDWQTLTADEADWDRRFPNPRFLGAWREHRKIYGYTLRSELVYQLKKALENRGDFIIDGPIKYLLVDEYQDLNRCDLAVIQSIATRNVELFVAGDDDQSIYGFRKAHPEGIRRFPNDYSGAAKLFLRICKRCDTAILNWGLFVAEQDHRRVPKEIKSERGKGKGEVALLRFHDQDAEAKGIAKLCLYLIEHHKINPNQILILLRSDHKGIISEPIRNNISKLGIPVSAGTDVDNSLYTDEGRAFLSFMRLAVNREDSLAWRTLLEIWCHGIGGGAISAIYDLAQSRGGNFAQILHDGGSEPSIFPNKYSTRLSESIQQILELLDDLFPDELPNEYETVDDLLNVVEDAADTIIQDELISESVLSKLYSAAVSIDCLSIEELVRVMEVSSDIIEQEIKEDAVNILTMHKAKGLTAEAVFIVAAEDQYIPGRADGVAIDDERRLLYVSLTRAMHHLFVTYCDRRTGQQQHTGRDSGRSYRSLTRFLIDSPHIPQDGRAYINHLVLNNK